MVHVWTVHKMKCGKFLVDALIGNSCISVRETTLSETKRISELTNEITLVLQLDIGLTLFY